MEDETEASAPEDAAPDGKWPDWAWPALAAAAIVALVISNLLLVLQVNDANDEIAALTNAIGGVDDRIDLLGARVTGAEAADESLTGAVVQLDGRIAAAEAAAADASREAAIAGAALPVFTGDPTNDPARGIVLAEIGGFEYYLGQEIGFDLTDGRSRAIVVWAHWCPFCQEELPALSDWIRENAAGLDNLEIISITTAIDDAAPNPLVPYLDASQFPFPVLVDENGDLARLLGVDAFPFWLFTGPDGAVVGRLTGLRGMDELGNLFAELDSIATG